MNKPLPKFDTDEAAEAFIEHADLTEYDLTGLSQMQFEFQPKSRSVTMRLPEQLYTAIKDKATKSGIPYQRLIRKILEDAVVSHK
ncbi:BrnA antitoxin family protein [Methylomonas paludis]|uniref:BrnA antitoxin family protein n=1 Tax=Methylomonas paludis TaxID=1173101 RepID=A0A975MNG7_9GAMM|nr:BrnA antitoxin family protein [Methylomonas paludis]QWF70889.1 BrnA antitoxin family protein [Methylomonas paludis]